MSDRTMVALDCGRIRELHRLVVLGPARSADDWLRSRRVPHSNRVVIAYDSRTLDRGLRGVGKGAGIVRLDEFDFILFRIDPTALSRVCLAIALGAVPVDQDYEVMAHIIAERGRFEHGPR